MFYKIGVLKNVAKFTGKRLCWSHFLIKLQTFRPAAFLKSDPSTSIFLRILQHFWKLLFYRTAPGDCLWNTENIAIKENLGMKWVNDNSLHKKWSFPLTLSWWRTLSYINQFTDLKGKSIDKFLFGRDLRHERVKDFSIYVTKPAVSLIPSFFVQCFSIEAYFNFSVNMMLIYNAILQLLRMSFSIVVVLLSLFSAGPFSSD